MLQSDSESDKDVFSQLSISTNDDGLVPPQPPSLLNITTHVEFPPSQADSVKQSDSDSNVVRVVLRLRVDASPGCGGIAWPAGKVLSTYVARRARSLVAGKNVIELGSGTGLVGLVAASAGAGHVWITDQAPLLDIMRANVVGNGLGEIVDIVEYNWGFPRPVAVPSSVDLILAADCVYFEPAFPLLVTTLCDLAPLSGPGTEVLFCYKKRRKADKRFFALLKKHFQWKQVDDDPDYPVYSRESISLLRLTRSR